MEEESISVLDSMFSSTIGRVMTTLLTSHPKKLRNAISRLYSIRRRSSPVSLDESLWFFHKYVRDAVEKESLDNIILPLIEHSLKYKESKYGNQTMILLHWLFEDELLFQAVATNLANIISRKQDRYITLGWCILVRDLLESDIFMSHRAEHEIGEKYLALLRIFCPCISHLLLIVCNGSILQDGFELPTRLSVAAADCILALSESLVQKQLFSESSGKPKSPIRSSANQPVSLLFVDTDQKKAKSTINAAEVFNSMEMESLLWDHLSELIILLQKLVAWSWKSRFLHAQGLGRVVKWLQGIQGSYEAGPTITSLPWAPRLDVLFNFLCHNLSVC